MQVFLSTARHTDDPQYTNSGCLPLEIPTDYTPVLLARANTILQTLFRPGYKYQKIGVLLFDLMQRDHRQLTLAEYEMTEMTDRRTNLMQALDNINTRYGGKVLHFAGSGTGKKAWHIRQRHLSQRFTTAWNELPVVH